MDIHTLQEKINRSHGLLSRLREELGQSLQDQLVSMEKSKEYLETLFKVKDELDLQINEKKANLSSFQNEYNSLMTLKEKLTQELSQAKTKEESIQHELEQLRTEKTQLDNTFSSLSTEKEALHSSVQEEGKVLDELKQSTDTKENELLAKLNQKENEKIILDKEIQDLKINNGALSYLLEESAEDIPEVPILAVIMKLKKVRTDELKDLVTGEVSPVMITRTLGRMVEKQLIRYEASGDTYTLY